jgi:hypothetical protein
LDATGPLFEKALVHVLLGEHDEAIAMLEQLLTVPSEISVTGLRTDPTWAPLRGHAGFERLLEESG